jgi:hypothetical protein
MIVVPDGQPNVQLDKRSFYQEIPVEATFNIIPILGGIQIQSRAFPELFLDAGENELGQMSMKRANGSPSQVFLRDNVYVLMGMKLSEQQ